MGGVSGIVGREAEVAVLERWLADPWARLALVEGEPGIGKTTIWRQACALAADAGHAVTSCAPAESERRLVFAGLTELLAPLLPAVADAMETPRREAIAAALLLGDGRVPVPDERAVAFAALDLLRLSGRRQPLVLAVDDAQWLDRSSLTVLAFAVRRLTPADRVALLVARRTGVDDDPSQGLVTAVGPERRCHATVGPLSLSALHRLYREQLDLSLPRPRLAQVHELSGGSPLFALEIARSLDGAPPGGPLPVPPSLAAALDARLAALTPAARRMTLVAAAAAQPTATLLDAALGSDGVTGGEVAELLAASILVTDGATLRFDHPLLASAAYAAATDAERSAVHAALAVLVTVPESRARHLALARDGPDAAAAAALDHAAELAEARGAQAAAGELREWAAAMTPPQDRGAHGRRLVAAGEAMFRSGDTGRARLLLERAAQDDGPSRYVALWVLGTLLDELEGGHAAREHWELALQTGDDALRVAIELSVALSSLWIDGIPAARARTTRAIATAERLEDRASLVAALAMHGAVLTLAGDPGAAAVLARGVALQGEAESPVQPWSPRAMTADCARHTLALDEARELYGRLRGVAVARGDTRLEAWAVCGAGQVALDAGDWRAAERLRDATDELSEQTGLIRLPALRLGARVDGHRGDAASCRTLAGRCLAEARAAGEPVHELYALTVLGALALAHGDAAAATVHLAPCHGIAVAHGMGAPGQLLFAIDAAEALADTGDPAGARALLDWFAGLAAGASAVWAPPLVDRCRGLIAAAEGDLVEALRWLERADAAAALVPVALQRARTTLCLGRVLRRSKRRADARVALERAVTAFVAAGSPPWVALARADLARIGGRTRTDGLTPTEERVAGLVSEGRTNKEVAAVLFVSTRTVEAHLTSVYGKLGVRSRGRLAAALAEQRQGVSGVSPGAESA
jgi:DNA-binding CsgD family transcriptional regulator